MVVIKEKIKEWSERAKKVDLDDIETQEKMKAELKEIQKECTHDWAVIFDNGFSQARRCKICGVQGFN